MKRGMKNTRRSGLKRLVREIRRAPDTPALISLLAADREELGFVLRMLHPVPEVDGDFLTEIEAVCREEDIGLKELKRRLGPAASALGMLGGSEQGGGEDFYDLLGVAPDATDAAIRKAYRERARELHPDLHPGADPMQFARVAEAYRVLGDPGLRSRYAARERREPCWVERSHDTFERAERQEAFHRRGRRRMFWQLGGLVAVLLIAVGVANMVFEEQALRGTAPLRTAATAPEVGKRFEQKADADLGEAALAEEVVQAGDGSGAGYAGDELVSGDNGAAEKATFGEGKGPPAAEDELRATLAMESIRFRGAEKEAPKGSAPAEAGFPQDEIRLAQVEREKSDLAPKAEAQEKIRDSLGAKEGRGNQKPVGEPKALEFVKGTRASSEPEAGPAKERDAAAKRAGAKKIEKKQPEVKTPEVAAPGRKESGLKQARKPETGSKRKEPTPAKGVAAVRKTDGSAGASAGREVQVVSERSEAAAGRVETAAVEAAPPRAVPPPAVGIPPEPGLADLGDKPVIGTAAETAGKPADLREPPRTAAKEETGLGPTGEKPAEEAPRRDRILAFLARYCGAYEALDYDRFMGYFTADAVENDQTVQELEPVYRSNFDRLHALAYHIELGACRVINGEVEVSGDYTLRWRFKDREWQERRGPISLGLVPDRESFKVRRLVYR